MSSSLSFVVLFRLLITPWVLGLIFSRVDLDPSNCKCDPYSAADLGVQATVCNFPCHEQKSCRYTKNVNLLKNIDEPHAILFLTSDQPMVSKTGELTPMTSTFPFISGKVGWSFYLTP